MNEVGISSINKDAKSLLSHLFYDKIIQLGSKSDQIPVAKQMEIKKIRDKVFTFIERQPNSEFEVRLLDKNTDNKEDYRIALSFRNYKETPETRVNRFLIVIDYVMSSITYYQWAINNVLIDIKYDIN